MRVCSSAGMCVYVCACACAGLDGFEQAAARVHGLIYMYAYALMHVCVYVHVLAWMVLSKLRRVCMGQYACVCVHTRAYACMLVCVYVCACVYVCVWS